MKPDPSIWKYVSLVSEVGLIMAIPVVGCILLGGYLDKRLGTKVVFTIVFAILGMVMGFRNLYRMSQREDALSEKDEKENEKK